MHACMCLCLHTHGIIHQLVQVFVKVGGGLLAKLRVHGDIRLHPSGLLKLERSMKSSDTQTETDVDLQVPIVENVARLGLQIRYELLRFDTRRLQVGN